MVQKISLIGLAALAICVLSFPFPCAVAGDKSHLGTSTPQPRYIRDLGADSPVIVFVHGVLGDGKSTWTNENGSYWPELMEEDKYFSNTSIFLYEYQTILSEEGLNINENAMSLRSALKDKSVTSHKKIVFLMHSMGGLIVRDYLITNHDVAANTRMLYFLSTPTTGSEIANVVKLVAPNRSIRKMGRMELGDYLSDSLNKWHESHKDAIPAYCAYETKKTYGVLVVEQASSSNLCNKPLDAIAADHISISKPSDKNSLVYIAFRNAFRDEGLTKATDGADKQSHRDENTLRQEASVVKFHYSGLSKEKVRKLREKIAKIGWTIDEGERIQPSDKRYKYNNNEIRYNSKNEIDLEIARLLQKDTDEVFGDAGLNVSLVLQKQGDIESRIPEIWLKIEQQ